MTKRELEYTLVKYKREIASMQNDEKELGKDYTLPIYKREKYVEMIEHILASKSMKKAVCSFAEIQEMLNFSRDRILKYYFVRGDYGDRYKRKLSPEQEFVLDRVLNNNNIGFWVMPLENYSKSAVFVYVKKYVEELIRKEYVPQFGA